MEIDIALVIRERAALQRAARSYFELSDAVEVEVPLLASAAATDAQLDSLRVETFTGPRYLHTSPEFFLKRLLCNYPHSIFTLTKTFRDGEAGRLHNPEFSMLEWYRVGADLHAIMEDTLRLVAASLSRDRESLQVKQYSYREIFVEYLQIDPHRISWPDLQLLVRENTSFDGVLQNADEALQLLLSQCIEPKLSSEFTLLTHFPASQAALAKTLRTDDGVEVAERFELYWRSLELANGYHELLDADEQARRFAADNQMRCNRGLPVMPVDTALLQAMHAGLPPCAGVSVGVDRLLACRLGLETIVPTLLFPWDLS